jgi:hypothetical protein
VMNAKDRIKTQVRINDLKRKSTAAGTRAAAIDAQKKSVDTVRRAIMTANGMDDGGSAAAGAPAGEPTTPLQAAPQGGAPKSATRAQVQAYAQRYKMSEQEAMDAFKKDGIAVR